MSNWKKRRAKGGRSGTQKVHRVHTVPTAPELGIWAMLQKKYSETEMCNGVCMIDDWMRRRNVTQPVAMVKPPKEGRRVTSNKGAY